MSAGVVLHFGSSVLTPEVTSRVTRPCDSHEIQARLSTQTVPKQSSRFDFDRYVLVPRSSPRQADLILIAGTVTMKMTPSLVRLYEQMPEPKYVIAMGACTIIGGMFSTDSYSTVRWVDKLIPVDVYLPGCPLNPRQL
ncbi:hypothetical protein J1N35_025329 [Gossypium stocksii]|uniref:NADH:ubiquinone oxidoreductase-like 20kDa subunit domain-containing protein n=1 Tax=Gossypium stocksii TaxID=47602 RepID=A0A9D3V6E8_9ROSI|nr:hypothetical protein J1N35_025329 [Gossypium stocksii]